jgi:hypothetical protein
LVQLKIQEKKYTTVEAQVDITFGMGRRAAPFNSEFCKMNNTLNSTLQKAEVKVQLN